MVMLICEVGAMGGVAAVDSIDVMGAVMLAGRVMLMYPPQPRLRDMDS